MNFTWSFYRREDRKWGSKLEDGSLNGMVSSLVKGEADLIATSLTMKAVRHEGADFLARQSTNIKRLDLGTHYFRFRSAPRRTPSSSSGR